MQNIFIRPRRYSLYLIILILLLPVLVPSDLYAKGSFVSAQGEKVVVTAKRVPTPSSRTAENVIILTEEEIEQYPVRNLAELLNYVPGVNIDTRTGFGQGTSVSIYGSEARQVLIMVDGVPFNTQLSGQANPSRIPIGNVKQIEVIKGASSSAWGSSLGGVINVITKDTGHSLVPQGSLTASWAEFDTTDHSIDLSGEVGDLGYYIFGRYFDTDGSRAFSDIQKNEVFTKLSHPLGDDAVLTGSFGYSGEDVHDLFLIPVFLRQQETRTNFSRYGNINLQIDKEQLSFNTAVKYNNQDIKTVIVFPDMGGFTSPVASTNEYFGYSLNGSMSFRENDVLVFGADFDWTTFKSSPSIDTSRSVKSQAPYVNYTWNWSNLDLIPGLRYDHNEQFGAQYSPSFGAVYNFDNELNSRARFKISRAFNAPPLLWVYTDTSSTLANPSLQAEKGTVYEIGFGSDVTEDLNLDLNVYYEEIEDAIFLVADVDGTKDQRQNFDRFRRRGVELLLNYDVNDDLSFYGSGAFNDAEDKVRDRLVFSKGIARQAFKFGAKYYAENGFGAHLAGYYNRWNPDPRVAPSNDRKPIFDLRLTKEFKDVKKGVDVETFLNVFNITNSKYWSTSTFPLPRRYFEGGFSLNF